MSDGIVDCFECVDIDKNDRNDFVVAFGEMDCLHDPILK